MHPVSVLIIYPSRETKNYVVTDLRQEKTLRKIIAKEPRAKASENANERTGYDITTKQQGRLLNKNKTKDWHMLCVQLEYNLYSYSQL